MARIQTKNTKLKTEKRPAQAGQKTSTNAGNQRPRREGSGTKIPGSKTIGNHAPGAAVSKVRQISDQEILELLLEDVFDEPTDYGAKKIQSLKKAGIESELAGVVVTMEDGGEYQVLIKKIK